MISLTQSNRKLSGDSIKKATAGFRHLLERRDVGFFQLPERESAWELSQNRASQIKDLYDHFVFVGIGGSGLGGRTIVHAQRYCFPAEQVTFLENVDQLTTTHFLTNNENLKRTHWCLISKSGSTLETLSIANCISDHLQKQGLKFAENATVISETKNSPLTRWAESENVPVLPIDLDVGGRFSVLSPVGLFPSACLGIDLNEMRAGARWALKQNELVESLAAHALESFSRQEYITQFWFYCDGLKVFGEWVRQLWAESLAKKIDIHGQPAPRVSTPMGCVGAIDQHSVLQQVMEGAKDKMIWHHRVKSAEEKGKPLTNIFTDFPYLDGKSVGDVLSAEASGMYSAYVEEDISVLELQWQDLSPETIAAAFMIYELVVGTIGQCLEIDAFNQPGVELGKKLAKKILLPN